MSDERTVTVALPYEQAVPRVPDVLAAQGSGGLTGTGVQARPSRRLTASLDALPGREAV